MGALDRKGMGFAVLLALACSDDTLLPAGSELRVGTWGGDNTGVIVDESAAHVHIGCTVGNIPGRIALDASGRFTVNGEYVLRAYPVAVGPPLPAQFSGRVIGRTLTLAVAVNDTVEHQVVALGPVSAVLGQAPRLGPCPICRVAPRPRHRP